MRIKSLMLHNIGPFNDCEIDLLTEEQVGTLMTNPESPVPVCIFTGENGTGKSVILDAIRTILGGQKTKIERDIVANKEDFTIHIDYIENQNVKCIESSSFTGYESLGVRTNETRIGEILADANLADKVNWIVDYWSPDLDTNTFKISSLSVVNPKEQMQSPFAKTFSNTEINKFVCFLDYLRGSEEPKQHEEGQFLYELVGKMIGDCLGEGRFLYVDRMNLIPKVEVRGKELSIDKLSMGNLLLFNHFISTLYRMYVVCERLQLPIEQVNKLPGVLLIDEIENHLHPKWQRKIISLIQKYFPNLQLIITTHSPFVVNSEQNANVWVCESKIDHSEVFNVTQNYSGLPVDEVLSGDVFGAVGPFNDRITQLLNDRSKAAEEGRTEDKKKIENELIELNASYFSYYKMFE